MRPASADRLEALAGGRGVEGVVAHVWYAGKLVAADLPVTSWSLEADATREVQSSLTLSVTDPDGALSPWSHTDTLGAAGHRIQLVYRFGEPDGHDFEQVHLGWYAITRVTVEETHRQTRTGLWVPTGAQIDIQADDLTTLLDVPFAGTEGPKSGARRIGEIRRIAGGVIPVEVYGVTDQSAGSEAYSGTRLSAIMDHVRAMDATARMTTYGSLVVTPDTAPAVSWTVEGGTQGVLISASRSYALEDLVNAGVAESSGGSDVEIVGRAVITSGPYRWGGPIGYRPKTHAAPIYTTQLSANRGAQTVLDRAQREQAVNIDVTCPANPYVEVGDTCRLLIPSVWGGVIDVTGQVSAYTLSGSGDAGIGPMSARVTVASDVLAGAVGRVRVR